MTFTSFRRISDCTQTVIWLLGSPAHQTYLTYFQITFVWNKDCYKCFHLKPTKWNSHKWRKQNWWTNTFSQTELLSPELYDIWIPTYIVYFFLWICTIYPEKEIFLFEMYDRLTVPTTCLQNTAQVTVWTFGEILVIHAGASRPRE